MPTMRRCRVLVLIAVLLIVSTVTGPFSPRPANAQSTGRIGGDDRYHTAVKISQRGWATSNVVFLARGDNYADALAGVPYAYRCGAPILLTRPDALPEATLNEIERLQADEVVILGGPAAVSGAVEQQLEALGLMVFRIGGENRFDTAAQIATRFPTLTGAVLVYGYNFPDALAAAAYAAREAYPILLTDTDTIPPETEAVLEDCGCVFIVGGERVISEKIFMHLSIDLAKHPVRISGADRYDTAVALAKHFTPASKDMYAATGLDFPDAITGAVLAALDHTGVLLVRDPLDDPLERYLQDYQVHSITLFGGKEAVGAAVADHLNRLIGSPPSDPPPVSPPPAADQPYLQMPLNTRAPAAVDAAFLNRAADRLRPDCPLSTMGETFMRAQETWGVNAVYLLAHAALESAWGTSLIARDKNNIYGFRAYDSNPYENAATFETVDDCIHYVSAYIRRAYLGAGGSYYRGPTLEGMNCCYATDPLWGSKIARIMQSILPYEAGSAYCKDRVWGVIDADALYLRRAAGSDAAEITSLPRGTIVEIHDLELVGDDYWYRVDSPAGEGWFSGKYITLQGAVSGAVYFPNWYLPEEKESLFLNIRSGPGIEYDPVARLYFGDRVSIAAMKMVQWTIWYRLAGSDEWVSGDFIIADW